MISDEAVEAAAKVLKYEDENPGHNYPQIARAALEAAAPHIAADAWDEGWGEGTLSKFSEAVNPYRSQA